MPSGFRSVQPSLPIVWLPSCNMICDWSVTYEVLQILSMSLTNKTPLREQLEKTKFNDVKVQFGPLIPGLFDYY